MGEMIGKVDNFVKRKPTICLFILLFVFVLLIAVGILVSYAYFTANVQGSGKQITISTSNAIVHFTDNNEINETGITPGTTITKTFYVTNTAHGSLQYKINWEYLINNFTYRNCLKYTITSTGGGGTLNSTQVPDSEDHINILNNITIPGNTTQNYTMTITYEDNGQNQDADKNKSLIGKIEVTDIEGNSIAPQTSTGTYTAPVTSSSTLYGYTMGQLMQRLYPVGSIYTSTSSTDPSELFPGTTWERYGKGKTLVGVDENDTAFNTVNKTGGTKDAIIPYHRHELNGTNAKTSNTGAHTHDISGSTSTDGAHTHIIAANGISVKSTATTTMTAMPNELAEDEDEKFESGVNYGEHGHTVTATGTNTAAYTISSSGAHTHTTTAKSNQTTGAGSAHSHSIPSLTVSTTSSTTGNESSHTHGFTVPALSGSTSSTSKTLTGQWYNTTARFPGSNTVSGIVSKVSGSISTYWDNTGGKDTNTYGWKIDATHTHNITTTAKSGNTTGAGSSHSHSIPALSGSTTASTTGNESSHTHSFDIPSLDIASSGSHTHTIATNGLTIGVSGSTVDSGHSGWHIHTVTIPALTSTNNNSITVPSTGSGHQHTITGTASTNGAHEHTLSGYTEYAGTNGNTTNANLQPYITVYMWKRVS